MRQSPGRELADVLLELDGVDAEAVLRVVADRAGLEFTTLDREDIDASVDGKMLQRLTLAFAKQHQVIPLRSENGRVVLGSVRPDEVFLLDEVRRRLGTPHVRVALVTPADVAAALEHFGAGATESVDLDDILGDIDEDDVVVAEHSIDEVDLQKQAGESPVIRYVNFILHTAAKEGASDIHIEPGEKKVKVRFRIDGVLFESMQPPRSMAAAITSRLKIMANLDISERRLPQDGRIRVTIQSRRMDLRLSTIPTPYGEKCVLRILDTRSINVELGDLGFDEQTLALWGRQIEEPHGIILVTGPTGSGKTTTLYASLRQMDKVKFNISTVEDPIEYHLDGVTQTQIHEKIDMTFGRTLKALLRQDPDVIMIGEIRDHETAHTAVQAALTGHLVLSTLHTNDAPSSVTRLVNIGLEPFLVGAAVNAVLAQRLVRRICPHCKEPAAPTGELAEFLDMNGIAHESVFKGAGCERCRQTGYSGRVGLYELLIADDALRDVIARNPNVSEFRRLCVERGMRTLRQDGLAKAAAGETTVQEVLRVTESSI
ncbi:MAG: type II secretion system protein GspE [Planctomycetota bacterium]|nr:MAG: type II secretion system protein GspE [Planctomycetota bacterium]